MTDSTDEQSEGELDYVVAQYDPFNQLPLGVLDPYVA